jgi:hypothetical protein
MPGRRTLQGKSGKDMVYEMSIWRIAKCRTCPAGLPESSGIPGECARLY